MILMDLINNPDFLGQDTGHIVPSGLTADSRDVKPGMVFAALKGASANGADFIDQAIAAGACAVLLGEGQVVPPDLPVPVIRSPHPRLTFSHMAARFYGTQPETIVAVTGTNGKTSVAEFTRQIWDRLGHAAASLGTVGLITRDHTRYANLTTPDPVKLHARLAHLAQQGVSHVAMEASSHGLAQYRLDGVRLKAAAFTNLSRDHLDYHGSFDAYFDAKKRLFQELIPEDATIVVDGDEPEAESIAAIARARGVELIQVGRAGDLLRLDDVILDGVHQIVSLTSDGRTHRIALPLMGGFQVSNALVAAALVIATGGAIDDAIEALICLRGAPGRMEHIGNAPGGAPVFVDYSHTPASLETALQALRPFCKKRLMVVFGCGGDRDRPKRAQMGEIADRLADVVIVTDDNPRSEDPAAIRAAIMSACPRAREIADRREAIETAIGDLQGEDLLLIAGKGHESGQIVGATVLPFSDRDVARAAVAERKRP